ncbi:MAG: lipoyl(octanoyl) transferase LipB [Thaumarchaeota archaeon]|nr:lipoyl(octanoyl) transferase LipB [Nitrososphaerota archaeon]
MQGLKISLLDLGFRDYGEVLKIQRSLVEQRKESKVSDTLILVEHPDVITLGRRGTMENVISKEFPIYLVERGGDATYHGQGQLVGYPIISLEKAKIDVVTLVRKLEEVLIRTSSGFGIKATRAEKKPGVWVKSKKLASIGIAVQHWVSFHGFALNINTDLNKFYTIKPCGMESSTMTSMQKILGKKVSFDDVKKSVVENFKFVFEAEIEESITLTSQL